MSFVIATFAFIAAAILLPSALANRVPLFQTQAGLWGFRGLMLLCALMAVLETSIISIPADQVGVVRKVYGFKTLPDGKLIAVDGESGYQAQVIPPGTFRISPFFNVINS